VGEDGEQLGHVGRWFDADLVADPHRQEQRFEVALRGAGEHGDAASGGSANSLVDPPADLVEIGLHRDLHSLTELGGAVAGGVAQMGDVRLVVGRTRIAVTIDIEVEAGHHRVAAPGCQSVYIPFVEHGASLVRDRSMAERWLGAKGRR